MYVFYLHGFASSPASGKARYFRDRLAAHGLTLDAPDFNLPDFASLTVTRMLDQLDAALDARPAGPVALIGSSLGAFVALHTAARRHEVAGQPHPVTGLILLAPALDFGADRRLDAVAEEWRRAGCRQVFHYAYGRPMEVGYALYEDARRYDSGRVNIDVPTLIFHGRRDEVVSPSTAIEFAASRPTVRLRLLDDDHQLQGHLPEIWQEIHAFLDLL
ncbi:MAG: alpha/beta fold hydrolase [Acidobacteria bacterium]|nr:MAG: alpha/beta fold hydrolase [Acidobacteriota bacterium]